MANVIANQNKNEAAGAQAEPTCSAQHFTPRVDILETDKELTLFAEMPGVRPNDVDLHYENGELVLHGRVEAKLLGKSMLTQEYAEGDFYRVFRIDETVDSTKIDAECKNGVLTVHLP